jgi:SagB-type dehydrogenase family enzyme
MNERAMGPAKAAGKDRGQLPTVSIEESIIAVEPAFDDPTETYHEASRSYPGIVDPTVCGMEQLLTSDEMRASVTRSAKRYDTAPVVRLPAPALGDALLADALARRRSRRCFESARLTLRQLGTLLGAAYGVSGVLAGYDQGLRTAPSGGGLYPLELYVATPLVEDLESALFHYDPLRHVLERVRAFDANCELEPLTPYPENVRRSAALIVITAMFWRSRFKYGSRAYRFILIEAGHVAQNLLLAATALDVAAVPIGGFYDRLADSLVGADGLNEATLYLCPLWTDA